MNSSKSAFVATIVVLILAIAAAVFAYMKLSDDSANSTERVPQETIFVPSEEDKEEMMNAAENLIKNNHTLITLYITRGLPHKDEPYGNAPEGGFYFADSEDYLVLDDVEGIVRETFIAEEAERVINNRLNNGRKYYNELVEKVFSDRDGRLGIHEDFKPYTDYPVSWEGVSYIITPITAYEVGLEIKLKVHGEETVFTRSMYKQNGNWLLDRFIYYESDSDFINITR